MHNLAYLYKMRDRSHQGGAAFHEGAGHQRRILGEAQPSTFITANSLAESYLAGRSQEATDLLGTAWAKAIKQPGLPVHDSLTLIRSTLGETYEQAGQFAKAEPPLPRGARDGPPTARRGVAPIPPCRSSSPVNLLKQQRVRRGRAAAPRDPEVPRAARTGQLDDLQHEVRNSAAACWARRNTPRPSRCSWLATRG